MSRFFSTSGVAGWTFFIGRLNKTKRFSYLKGRPPSAGLDSHPFRFSIHRRCISRVVVAALQQQHTDTDRQLSAFLRLVARTTPRKSSADRIQLKFGRMTVIPPISTFPLISKFPPNRVEWLNGGNGGNLIAIHLEMVLVENPPISTFPPISNFPPNSVEWLNGGNGGNFISIQSEMVLVDKSAD